MNAIRGASETNEDYDSSSNDGRALYFFLATFEGKGGVVLCIIRAVVSTNDA